YFRGWLVRSAAQTVRRQRWAKKKKRSGSGGSKKMAARPGMPVTEWRYLHTPTNTTSDDGDDDQMANSVRLNDMHITATIRELHRLQPSLYWPPRSTHTTTTSSSADDHGGGDDEPLTPLPSPVTPGRPPPLNDGAPRTAQPSPLPPPAA